MPGQPYTPRYPTNRASLPRDPTPSRTMMRTSNLRQLGEVLDGLAPLQPYDRVLNLAKQSDLLREMGLPGDLHDRLDLSDRGLMEARAVLSPVVKREPTVWEQGLVPSNGRLLQGLPSAWAMKWGRIMGSGPNGEVTAKDRDSWARTAWGEAENQSDDGLLSVTGVMGNRSKYDNKPIGEVLDEGNGSQFNSRRGRRRVEMDNLPTDSPGYRRADEMVGRVLAGEDPTHGAYYFYNDQLQRQQGRPKPGFDDGSGERHGDHLFFQYEAGHRKPKP